MKFAIGGLKRFSYIIFYKGWYDVHNDSSEYMYMYKV